jgi:hypothetical protein
MEKTVKTYERHDPHEVALYQFELALLDIIRRFKEDKSSKPPKDIISKKESSPKELSLQDKPKKELSLQDKKENIIGNAKEFANMLDLSTYDMNLLAIAALFDYIYKNKVNQENVTTFIKGLRNTADPIDIIRYIRIYQLLKAEIAS